MKTKVLIIDDDQMVRSGLGLGLEGEGYVVSLAESGHAGLEMIGEQKPDVVLLDIFMDDMDGIEVLERIRRISPRLPVVMITGHGSMVTSLEALRLGANDYILKPADSADVAHRVEAALEMQRQRDLAESAKRWRDHLSSLQTLAGGVAHDFNNQLTVVISCAEEILRQLPEDSSARREVDWITYSANVMANLSAKMLAYSGGGILNLSETDLGAFLARAVNSILADLHTKIDTGIDIDLNAGDGEQLAAVDSGEMESALKQLLVNAAEASAPEYQPIHVSLARRELDSSYFLSRPHASAMEPGEYYEVEVKDSGCGMDEETLRNVFDPFFSTKFPGRGLGLPSAQGIVMAHGGVIHIDSRKGEGTVATIYLPTPKILDTRNAIFEEERSETEPLTTSSGRVATVLIVEDDEAVRRITKHALAREGMQVYATGTGSEAVELYRRHTDEIDLILLDFTLPVMDGGEVLQAIRAINPAAKVIVTSGYLSGDVAGAFGQEKPDGFIDKPYELKELAKKVIALVSKT
ncbi:MAG: response regulator [Verrucomicrobia bacterium]|nr:response regulator [Verrucomicrobiota bacterium]